ncbi:hypothetical protein K9L67_00080 [Candidatus Woesearchaeota archaeon]|nr:hypothetical protein [Candidatus Woesearchaeota archaeon]MCF7900604.1 hypothetical protein [Candidatus Woesearchaeota archaeon]MCF8013906.1 hypothetical protein [Candidatus Woesearchaeota archaeon]
MKDKSIDTLANEINERALRFVDIFTSLPRAMLGAIIPEIDKLWYGGESSYSIGRHKDGWINVDGHTNYLDQVKLRFYKLRRSKPINELNENLMNKIMPISCTAYYNKNNVMVMDQVLFKRDILYQY